MLAPDDNGYLSYDTATGRLSRLNPAAALIAELCGGTRNASEIEAAVAPLLRGLGTGIDGLLIGLAYGAVGLLSGFCLMSSLRGWWSTGRLLTIGFTSRFTYSF